MQGIEMVYLNDYRVPAYLVDDVYLDFSLQSSATGVVSRVHYWRSPEVGQSVLDNGRHLSGLAFLKLQLCSQPDHICRCRYFSIGCVAFTDIDIKSGCFQ